MKPDGADSPSLHRAFHRMAFLFANLVCGIWLVLLTTLMVVDPQRPGAGSVLMLVLVSAPIAYAIPYAMIRLAGVLVVTVRRRRQKEWTPPQGGRGSHRP